MADVSAATALEIDRTVRRRVSSRSGVSSGATGTVTVAVVAPAVGIELDVDDLLAGLRRHLAGYKVPKAVHLVAEADLPRSTTGKIQRHEVERWLGSAATGAIRDRGEATPPGPVIRS